MNSSSASDEDDAPQEFSAVQVRQQHVSQLKEFHQTLKKSKTEAKEKRRKRDELFKAQKERKIQELMKRKLPQDVLDAVSTKLTKKDGKSALIAKSDEKLEDEEPVDRLADSGVEDGEFDTFVDFIPIKGTKNLFVATDEGVKMKKNSAAQPVLNFKHSHLYNHSVIPRDNSKQRKARAAKLNIFRKNRS